VRNSTLYLTGAAIHLSLESLAFAAAPGGPAQSREAALDLEDVGLEGGVVAPSTPDAAPSLHGIISFHLADGVGLGGQLRAGSRSLRASVAYVPQHFIIDDDPQDDKFARFKLANTGQLNWMRSSTSGSPNGASRSATATAPCSATVSGSRTSPIWRSVASTSRSPCP